MKGGQEPSLETFAGMAECGRLSLAPEDLDSLRQAYILLRVLLDRLRAGLAGDEDLAHIFVIPAANDDD